MNKLSLLDKAHLQLSEYDWSDYFIYDESSPTCLIWKSEFRKSRGSGISKRKSMIVGGLSQDKSRYIVVVDKKPRSIPKIIWIMHNGTIPEGYSVFFNDNNPINVKLSNLYIRRTDILLTDKYCEELKKYLTYDESSASCLRWIERTSNGSRVKSGDVAGSLDISDGYWKINGLGSSYRVHRIVWYLHYGLIPEDYHIDHIDRNRQNNKISNLRAIPQSINGKNRTKNSNNSTGENGISYSEFYNHRGTLMKRYVVGITANGVKYSKSFSVLKYGKYKALELAIAYKNKIFDMLKENAVGFTDDHGT